MHIAHGWDESLDTATEPVPSHLVSLTSSLQSLPPTAANFATHATQSKQIPWYCVVVQIPLNHAIQPLADNGYCLVPPSHQLLPDGVQCRSHPLLHCQAQDLEAALPVGAAAVRKSKKVEGFRLALAPTIAILCGKPTQLDQPRLLLAQLAVQRALLTAKDEYIARHAREIKFKDAKIERITFELARLKAWKFGARTEAMNAQQRQMFEDTVAEDEANLEAQLQGASEPVAPLPAAPRTKPRRQPLPESLRRVEHHHEPESTTCPTPACGQAMVRIGEDVSERQPVVPTEFFGLAGRFEVCVPGTHLFSWR